MKHQPKYCLFYDNHTMPACPDVGENFDVETFTDKIKAINVDYLVFHARCNQGMAYYDTRIGIKHPSLKQDLFGLLADACKRKDIALGAYFNAGISSEEGRLHRDWTTLYFDGRSLREPRFTPHVRTMCYNSGYRDHLIEMVKEVVTNYPVSGLMIDCLIDYPCVCPICVKEMKEKGINWNNEEEVKKFSEFSAIRLAKDISHAANAIKPGLLISNNYPGYEGLKGINTYFDVVCLPASEEGYEFIPAMSHYVRTLGDMPILNMTGRFYDWGDFGGLRPEVAIKSELLYGLANGMRPNIGGHFHPRGDLETATFDRIERIYKDLQTREEWFDNARNITEIAIVYPKSIHNIRGDKELKSAVRMLSELKHQFDVVTLASDWSKYKVLIFPDNITFDGEITRRVKKHISEGKAVISTGSSGLDKENKRFALEQEWGVRYIGENDFDPAYFHVEKNYNHSMPDMPLSLYSSGIDMEPSGGTRVGAFLIRPYYNRMWDGEYAFYYNPPDKETEKPALTIHNKVAHFSHRIFSGYFEKAPVELRTVFDNVLQQLLPDPLIRHENLPSFTRAFVTGQQNRTMVHLLSYIPEMRGRTQMIEEPIELSDLKISIRKDNRNFKNIYSAPDREPLSYQVEGNYIEINIPKSKGYTLIVLEENNY